MEIMPEEYEAHAPSGNSRWFASEGIGKDGQGVVINFFAETREDADALAQGLGIAHDVHCHQKAKFIGRKSEYDEFNQ